MIVTLGLSRGLFEVGIVEERFYEVKIKSAIAVAKRLKKKPKIEEPANGVQFGILYPVKKDLRLDILATENEDKAGEIMLRRVYERKEDPWTGSEKQYLRGFLVQARGNIGLVSIFSGTHFFRPKATKK